VSWDPGHFERPSQTEWRPADPEPVPHPSPPQRHWLRRLLAPVIAAGLLLWKVIGPLLIAIKSIKFLSTGVTFLVSIAAYATIWGWRFAVGFTVLLFIHEMGHVLQLRREGVPFTAPLFIPFLGAFVGMKQLPENAYVEAKVGLAGPVIGTLGAAACFALAVTIDSDLLRAVSYTGFFLNLINLIPVLPLDGGRAAAAFHPAFWFVGLFVVALLFFLHHNLILLLILLLGGYELYNRWSRRHDPESRAYHQTTWRQRLTIGAVYIGLVVVLVVGMDASYIHREL
jgi:Zn-dependent protease